MSFVINDISLKRSSTEDFLGANPLNQTLGSRLVLKIENSERDQGTILGMSRHNFLKRLALTVCLLSFALLGVVGLFFAYKLWVLPLTVVNVIECCNQYGFATVGTGSMAVTSYLNYQQLKRQEELNSQF